MLVGSPFFQTAVKVIFGEIVYRLEWKAKKFRFAVKIKSLGKIEKLHKLRNTYTAPRNN